jgi:hypothetical protein
MTITFDKNSPRWSVKPDMNLQYLMMQDNYLTDLFKRRGYIYLNEVYEAFGAVWNPLKNNVCWIKGADKFRITYTQDIFGNWLVTVH